MIRLNCFFQAKEGKFAEALEAAKALTAESLKQDGCVAYDVFESATRKDVFIICETWRDDKALADHSASAPFVKFFCGLFSSKKFIYYLQNLIDELT
jgi:quinol monooxygenase YgiN